MSQGGSLSELLKRAIAKSGLSHNAIAKATGVQRASIDRFMNGERTLQLDNADALAAYFGLTLKGGKMSPAGENLTNQERYDAFFQPLVAELLQHSFTRPRTGNSWNWYKFRCGPSWVRYGTAFADNRVRAYILIACNTASENATILNQLETRRHQIEQEFGEQLNWDFQRDTIRQEPRIEVYRPGSIEDDAQTLEEIRAWIIDHLCRLRDVFGPILPELRR